MTNTIPPRVALLEMGCALATLLLLLIGNTQATPYTLFGIDRTSSKVVTIDILTDVATDFANLPFDASTEGGLGFDYRTTDSTLYISRPTALGLTFYSVNLSNSNISLTDKIIPSITEWSSIGFTDTGDLYVYFERSAFDTGDLVYADWSTMTVTPRSNGLRSPSVLGGDYDTLGDVFWVSDEWDGKIYQLDAQTGERVWTSSSTWFQDLTGDMLDMDVTPSGEILVVAQGPYGSPDYAKQILTVNRDDGTWTPLVNLDPASGIDDIATVPEPSTYALLLLSGAASLWALRRRKS